MCTGIDITVTRDISLLTFACNARLARNGTSGGTSQGRSQPFCSGPVNVCMAQSRQKNNNRMIFPLQNGVQNTGLVFPNDRLGNVSCSGG